MDNSNRSIGSGSYPYPPPMQQPHQGYMQQQQQQPQQQPTSQQQQMPLPPPAMSPHQKAMQQQQHMHRIQAQQQQLQFQQQQVQRQQQQVQRQQQMEQQRVQRRHSASQMFGAQQPQQQQQRMSQQQMMQRQQQKQQSSKSNTMQQSSSMANNPGTPINAAPPILSRGNSAVASGSSAALPLQPPPSTMPRSGSIPGIKSQPPPSAARNPVKPPMVDGVGLPPTKLNNVKSGSTGKNATGSMTSAQRNSMMSSQPHPLDESQYQALLNQCDWKDKTLWISRQVLGGQNLNGFLRATATVQRLKKQRARQVKGKMDDTNKKRDLSEQAAEEELKTQVMNVRTAKKIRTEMESGRRFCALLHGCIRSILKDMGNEYPVPPILGSPESTAMTTTFPTGMSNAATPMAQPASLATAPPPDNPPTSIKDGVKLTLRRSRKKKLPPNLEPKPDISEFNAAGKRVVSKKEHANRLFESYRFRSLKKGDLVAARVSSRDLWILAQVQEEFAGPPVSMNDFLQLTEAKRDQVFRNKVSIKDVEDKNDGATSVARQLILPLPRSYSEAAEWCQRYKKTSRVYAMYPKTTSLYTATVVDSTTYCKDDDDIVVVVFDGDEPGADGNIPECHIPARFVTLIPSEFPGSEPQQPKKRKKAQEAASSDAVANNSSNNDPLGDITLGGFDDLDDLDFDLGFS